MLLLASISRFFDPKFLTDALNLNTNEMQVFDKTSNFKFSQCTFSVLLCRFYFHFSCFFTQDAVELHTLFLHQLEKMLQAENKNTINEYYVGELLHVNK